MVLGGGHRDGVVRDRCHGQIQWRGGDRNRTHITTHETGVVCDLSHGQTREDDVSPDQKPWGDCDMFRDQNPRNEGGAFRDLNLQ